MNISPQLLLLLVIFAAACSEPSTTDGAGEVAPRSHETGMADRELVYEHEISGHVHVNQVPATYRARLTTELLRVRGVRNEVIDEIRGSYRLVLDGTGGYSLTRDGDTIASGAARIGEEVISFNDGTGPGCPPPGDHRWRFDEGALVLWRAGSSTARPPGCFAVDEVLVAGGWKRQGG